MRIAIGLLLLVLALAATAYLLPSRYHVSRSIDIDAPPSSIYPLVAEVRAWKQWSAWNARDPAMEIVYSGPPGGTGAQWTWKSRSEGSGEMAFTDAEPDRRIDYTLSFPDFGMRANGALTFDPLSATRTRVTWTNEGDLGNDPMMRWMGLTMDRMVGKDFETGLANLKALATR